MVNCSCYHDVLLLNFGKKHSKRTINKCHLRIGKVIEANAIEFYPKHIELVHAAAKAIISGHTMTHNCDQTPAIVKLIKKKLAKKQLMIAETGTVSSRALVPYYPDDDSMMPYVDNNHSSEESTIDIEDTMDAAESETPEDEQSNQSQSIGMDIDGNDDDVEILMIKENKNPRKCHVKNMAPKERKDYHQPIPGCSFWPDEQLRADQKTDGGPTRKRARNAENLPSNDFEYWLNKWCEENRKVAVPNAEDLLAITDHYYKNGNPRFYCRWKNGQDPTWESASVIASMVKVSNVALSNYLKNLKNNAFRNLIVRAPELIYAVSAVNRRESAQTMGMNAYEMNHTEMTRVKKEEDVKKEGQTFNGAHIQ